MIVSTTVRTDTKAEIRSMVHAVSGEVADAFVAKLPESSDNSTVVVFEMSKAS
jgi:hypothetical protein